MDEHKTDGITEFLKRELRAWEDMRDVGHTVGVRHKKRKRALIVAALAAVAVTVALAAVFLVPWESIRLPVPDGTQDSGQGTGGLPPVTEGSTGEPAVEQTTEADTEQEQDVPDPYVYDFSLVPAGAVPIVPYDLTAKQNPVNQTDGVIDIQEVMSGACLIPAPRNTVSVLIIHTHTGEGYNREDALYLESEDGEFARSTSGTDGVLAVGARLAQRLNEAGIGTIHCKTVFDGESNRESYARAAEAIEAFRLAYPGLVCVIDVHRTAATDEQGNIVRSLAVMDGQGIAQTQVICGMNAGSASKTNLALAMRLYQAMNTRFAGSCAAVICKDQSLNQDLLPFSVMLEIGSCGNTPAEALAAADVAADALCTLFETP